MLQLELRPRAAIDIESAIIYVGEQLGNPRAARRLYDKMMEALDRLCEMPQLGGVFQDERLEGHGYRSFLVGDYRVFYTSDATTLVVWRVVHVRQDIDIYQLTRL